MSANIIFTSKTKSKTQEILFEKQPRSGSVENPSEIQPTKLNSTLATQFNSTCLGLAVNRSVGFRYTRSTPILSMGSPSSYEVSKSGTARDGRRASAFIIAAALKRNSKNLKKKRQDSEKKVEKKRRDSAVKIAQFVKKNSGKVRCPSFSCGGGFSAIAHAHPTSPPTSLLSRLLLFLRRNCQRENPPDAEGTVRQSPQLPGMNQSGRPHH